MVTKRRGKRKSPSSALVFEVSDDDVSPDNSDNECNEPETKILKTDSKFVASVVTALSNLENEALIKPKSPEEEINKEIHVLADADKSRICTHNVDETFSTEILTCISPGAKFLESLSQNKTEDFEEGELDNENIDEADSCDDSIQIKFSNEETSNFYKNKFLLFLTTIDGLQIVKDDKLSITLKSDPSYRIILDESESNCIDNPMNGPNENPQSDSLDQTPTKKKKRKKSKKEKDLFVLDTTPSHHENTTCAKYLSKFNIDINENNDEVEVKVSSQVCFNCEQGHALKDCPIPRDHLKISMMRQRFKKDKQTSRYHLEEEQKYAHLVPGKISDKLREALGIKRNQLPPYLYQMRVLGYPPGWLDEAKLVYSNLSLFDTEGKDVRLKNLKKNHGLDSNKIVEYPGFNAPMEKECKDEYKQYRVPSYSESYSKSAMIEYFEKEYSKYQDDFESKDMDVDIIEDIVTQKVDTTGKSVLRATALSKRDHSVPSPSLVDLETQKETLLAALDDSSSNLKSEENTNDVPGSDSSENSKEPSPPGEDETNIPPPHDHQTESVRIEITDDLNVTADNSEPFQSASSKSVLNSTFGTPILKSSSPYSRLPNPDNFMKDVSPVINFENLPNSTGKYEQMTCLLHKVRNTMKHLQNCDS